MLGFLSTVRDGHPDTPILVITPIYSPEREDQTGGSGMTLQQIRHDVGEGVRLLQKHGATNVQLLDGLDVLGPEHEDRLFDNLHPDAEGYELMASRIMPAVKDLCQ